jgi:O-antigen/teichoic acid export membrane protein
MAEKPQVAGNTTAKDSDIHGQNKLARNILTNWGAQIFQIVSGFIVPRLIDRQLSQEALGVWDLAWSVVVYFNLIQMGVTSSINRYVAFHRAQDDFNGINRVVSSVSMIMRIMGGVVFLLTFVFSWAVGILFAERLGAYVTEARWLVFFLGLNVVVQINATVYSSILTGCHRWDWHNGIQAGTNIVLLVGMVGVLSAGQGLIALAIVNLAGEGLGRVARVVVTYRICPWLEIKKRHFQMATAKEMLSFGGKTFTTQVSQLVMNSTVNVMIAAHLGPAALALYARPLSLVRNLGVFINKYAMVFSPTISSFQGAGKHAQVQDLALKATRYGLYLALPALLFLVIFGGEVLRVWMGKQYANPLLVALVVLAFLAQVSHIPLFKALVGLNFHGQPGVVNLGAALLTIISVYVNLTFFRGGLLGVAACVAVIMTLTNAIYLPLYACHKLKISVGTFWREVWQGPVLCAIPYLLVLIIARILFSASIATAALVGAAAGLLVLVLCYWNSVLPERWKAKLLKRFPRFQSSSHHLKPAEPDPISPP